MAPKKRERDNAARRTDQGLVHHELFLQAYERPTQIYKYLRSRNKYSPLYLNRTLTYMPKKRRPNKSSQDFDINSLLFQMENMKRDIGSQIPTNARYLTITFLGFYDKQYELYKDPVKVDTVLLILCHKKRKEIATPLSLDSYGPIYIHSNLNKEHGSAKRTISIPTEKFTSCKGHNVKSFHLLLRVRSHFNGIVLDDAPVVKRRRVCSTDDVILNGNGNNNKDDNHRTGVDDDDNFKKLYGTNLIIYDKQNKCLLPDGEYQLLLHEIPTNSINKLTQLNTSWETIPLTENVENSPAFSKFTVGPNLRCRLTWSKDSTLECNRKIRNGDIPVYREGHRLADGNSKKRARNDDNHFVNGCKQQKIVYQFLYSDNNRQQSETSDNFDCPWCSLNCRALYALLKHLQLCHGRFSFSYVPTSTGARIDVSMNGEYDASNIISRQLIDAPVGYRFPRYGPIRRTPVSDILVCHPKRPPLPNLSEFVPKLEENESCDSQRSFVPGHHRIYHHTTTALPIHPKEVDVDSEGEPDPKWLRKKTQMMIDDFTDVNDGEKELMKMWNLHIMHHGFVGDCQIPLACSMFLESRGEELLSKNLYRNFVLHLCNMFDFGVISPVTVYTIVQRLQQLIGNNSDVSKILHESWNAQRKYSLSDDKSKLRKLKH